MYKHENNNLYRSALPMVFVNYPVGGFIDYHISKLSCNKRKRKTSIYKHREINILYCIDYLSEIVKSQTTVVNPISE